MVVGFNHNFRYKNETFHVQTEDGGLKSPNIITLLYRGGTILASKKTSYADIVKSDNLDKVVEELMKEQHKEMLRRLKDGEFDEVIESRRPQARTDAEPAAPAAVPPAVEPPAAVTPASVAAAPTEPEPLAAVVENATASVAEEPAETRDAPVELGLDDIILSYLVGDD